MTRSDLAFVATVLPLWAAALPLATINICYLVAIGLDHVPACFPYISGCTNVSSTGRIAPESLIFKVGMIPSAVIMALFWWRSSVFLQIVGQPRYPLATLRLLGVVAGLFLILHTVALGLHGDTYRLLRRIGINGFILSTYLAQVLFIIFYRHMSIAATRKLWRLLVVICVVLLALAIASEMAKWAGAPRDTTNNIVAWNAFVVLCTYFVVASRLWRHHGFSTEFRLNSKTSP